MAARLTISGSPSTLSRELNADPVAVADSSRSARPWTPPKPWNVARAARPAAPNRSRTPSAAVVARTVWGCPLPGTNLIASAATVMAASSWAAAGLRRWPVSWAVASAVPNPERGQATARTAMAPVPVPWAWPFRMTVVVPSAAVETAIG